jgi:hypothetical protein
MAAAPVKAPEALAESQMRQLDNQEGLSTLSPLPRVQLDSLERVRREMARLYVEGKHGRRDVQEVSRLANVLALIGRMIEGADLERRIETLERQAQSQVGRCK